MDLSINEIEGLTYAELLHYLKLLQLPCGPITCKSNQLQFQSIASFLIYHFIHFLASTRKLYNKRLRDHLMNISRTNQTHEKINKMERDIDLLRRRIENSPIRSNRILDETKVSNRRSVSVSQNRWQSLTPKICCQLLAFIIIVMITSYMFSLFSNEINSLFLKFINFLIEFLKKLSNQKIK